MASSLVASCLSFMNSSSKEFKQFMVSDRESTMERLEVPICAIQFLSYFIFCIWLAISCRSFSRWSCSYLRLWTCRCRSTYSCYSFCTFMILLSILISRCESQEQILFTRLEKQVAVLSQMFLKNITAQKSSEKSCTLPSGSSLCKILTMSSFCADLIYSAKLMTSSFVSMRARTSRPILLTLKEYMLTISAQMASILMLDLLVISSMKSLMASLALQERMFRMCLLFTKLELFMFFIMLSSFSLGMNFLFLSSFRGCLKSRILPLSMRWRRNFCYSASKREPLSFLSSSIFLSSLWQSWTVRSLQALLTISITPYLMSSKVLKDLSRFLVSLGSLSALDSLMCDSSIINTIFTFGQISSSLCTKKLLDISYSSPLLSLNPGQSQNARFSITTLFGTEVQEYFQCPILMILLGQSRMGLRPSQRTVIQAPERKAMMVLLPTPVSPMTMMASLQLGSLGMHEMPFLIISLIFSRFKGFSI